MSNQPIISAVRGIIRLLASEDPHERDHGADQVTDILGSLAPDHVFVLARMLVFARSTEVDETCQESQLNALAHLHSLMSLPEEVLAPLRNLGRLTGSQVEHLKELLHPR